MGLPKGTLRVHGRPILEYLLERLNWPGPKWLITAPGREHPPGCERFDREISDPVAGLGPLRGILTGLEELTRDWLLVATVDMPGIRREHLEWLVEQSRLRTAAGFMCRRSGPYPASLGIPPHPSRVAGSRPIRSLLPEGEGTGGTCDIEPFPMLMRREAGARVRRRMEERRLSVHGLLEEPGFEAVEAPATWDTKVWENLNRPEDLRRFSENAG